MQSIAARLRAWIPAPPNCANDFLTKPHNEAGMDPRDRDGEQTAGNIGKRFGRRPMRRETVRTEKFLVAAPLKPARHLPDFGFRWRETDTRDSLVRDHGDAVVGEPRPIRDAVLAEAEPPIDFMQAALRRRAAG